MATIKKVAPKAQKGKKVDANTTIQKAKLDNKYNKIYAQTKRDSVAESNKELPYTYAKLREKTGKSPSAAALRAAQDKQNKEVVKKTRDPKNTSPSPNPKNDKGIKMDNEIKEARRRRFAKTQGKSPLDAKGRADAIFLGMKSGGTVKKKMKNGGSLSGLKASNKRVGPVDPKGAFTKVQKKTLKGAKGKASLTKDKQLGATKMAKRGMSIKKK
jgi:hypothetical protein